MIERIDPILDQVRAEAQAYFAPQRFEVALHLYGRDGVMGPREPKRNALPHELGLVIDVIAADQESAHAICHHISGTLLHFSYPGQFNTSGNLAFLHSPSELDAGPAYRFSIYHLMKVDLPTALFPTMTEAL